MDLKSELNDTIAESRKAKKIQDFKIQGYLSKANTHNGWKNMWSIIILFLVIAIVGLYVNFLSFASHACASVLSWIGLGDYVLYVCIVLTIIGIVRIFQHIAERDKNLSLADEIAKMSLKQFKHKYL